MIDVAFVGGNFFSGVLAATPVAFANGPRGKFGALHGNFGVGAQDHHGRNPDSTAHGSNTKIVIAHVELEPALPGSWTHGVEPCYVETDGGVGRHATEGFGGGDGVDGLPVAIEDENNFLIQDASIKCHAEYYRGWHRFEKDSF